MQQTQENLLKKIDDLNAAFKTFSQKDEYPLIVQLQKDKLIRMASRGNAVLQEFALNDGNNVKLSLLKSRVKSTQDPARLKALEKEYDSVKEEIDFLMTYEKNPDIQQALEDSAAIESYSQETKSLKQEFARQRTNIDKLSDATLSQHTLHLEKQLDQGRVMVELFKRGSSLSDRRGVLETLDTAYKKLKTNIDHRIAEINDKQSKLDRSEVDKKEFNQRFSELQQVYSMRGTEDIPNLKSVATEAIVSEKDALKRMDAAIQSNEKHIETNQDTFDSMNAEVRNYISEQQQSIQTKAQDLGPHAETEINTQILALNDTSPLEQVKTMQSLQAKLEERKSKASQLTDLFEKQIATIDAKLDATTKEITQNTTIHLKLPQYIDASPALKELLTEPKDLPDGVLYCVKDMTLWSSPPTEADWDKISIAAKAYKNNESWALQAVDLYAAIYKYEHGKEKEGAPTPESYKQFKQDIRGDLFDKKTPLETKKDKIMESAQVNFTHKSGGYLFNFLVWIESQFAQLFAPKTQKEIKEQLGQYKSEGGASSTTTSSSKEQESPDAISSDGNINNP